MTSPPPRQPSPVKATIQAMKAQRNGTADKPSTLQPVGDPIPVQFNPTSLKLERSNDTSTGAVTRAQRRQQPNEGHVTLSLELVFDTAEGGPDGKPMDVRTLTAGLRQFAEPDPHHPKDARPALRFMWGHFTFTGVVSRIGEELDYFASDGTALRAKVSLSLTGQDEKFEASKTGPGSRDDTRSTPPGAEPPNSGPGAPPTSNPNQAAAAQAGESVQQLLTRLGADPSTWRSAMAGLTTPLGLTAGAQVQLDASISAGAGVGVSAGFSAGASAGFAGGLGAGGSVGVAAGGEAIGSAGVSAEVVGGVRLLRTGRDRRSGRAGPGPRGECRGGGRPGRVRRSRRRRRGCRAHRRRRAGRVDQRLGHGVGQRVGRRGRGRGRGHQPGRLGVRLGHHRSRRRDG